MWQHSFRRIKECVLYNVIRLFRIRSATEHVARGFAVGLIPNFFPTFGLGFLASAFLARITGGSTVAGFIGGAALTFFWPVLFFLNMKTGSIFITPRLLIVHLDDVTEESIRPLLCGPAFTTGAILNGLIVAGCAYVAILLFYARLRPWALAYFRSHARLHRRQNRRWRSGPGAPPAT